MCGTQLNMILTETQLISSIEEIEPKIIKSLNKYAANQNVGFDRVNDALQEAKIRAFVHINTYDVTKPFLHWFLRIALNCMSDIVKKNSKLFTYSIEQIYEATGDRHIPSINNIDDEIFWVDCQEKYNEAFEIYKKLPLNLRIPLYKREVLDMSYEEMSAEMNIKIPALRVSVCRAKKKAQEIIKNHLVTTQ